MAEKQNQRAAKKPRQTDRERANFPVSQGKSQGGYGNPPAERQFKPGESGNPKGPPKRRVQLWTYICRYMALTETALNRLDTKKLTQAQQWALQIVKSTRSVEFSKLDRFARYVIDRDEGKPTEHVIFGDEDALSDDECEEIRGLLLKSHVD